MNKCFFLNPEKKKFAQVRFREKRKTS